MYGTVIPYRNPYAYGWRHAGGVRYGRVVTAPSRELAPEPAILTEDARAIQRVREDERAAGEARQVYRTRAIRPIDPTADLLPYLGPDEVPLAMRSTSLLEDCGPSEVSDLPRTDGPIYVTNERLVQLGRARTVVELRSIDELALAGERLLLTLRDGRGFAIDLPQPRLFRVEVAAAIRTARR